MLSVFSYSCWPPGRSVCSGLLPIFLLEHLCFFCYDWECEEKRSGVWAEIWGQRGSFKVDAHVGHWGREGVMGAGSWSPISVALHTYHSYFRLGSIWQKTIDILKYFLHDYESRQKAFEQGDGMMRSMKNVFELGQEWRQQVHRSGWIGRECSADLHWGCKWTCRLWAIMCCSSWINQCYL